MLPQNQKDQFGSRLSQKRKPEGYRCRVAISFQTLKSFRTFEEVFAGNFDFVASFLTNPKNHFNFFVFLLTSGHFW